MNLTAELSEVKNYINGQFERNGQNSMDIINPADGNIISTLPLSNYDDVNKAVQAAKTAFNSWSAMTFKERVQIFFRYRTLLEKHIEELTKLVQLENGKTYGEAKAEVEKSMELCEFAVSIPQIIVNEVSSLLNAEPFQILPSP